MTRRKTDQSKRNNKNNNRKSGSDSLLKIGFNEFFPIEGKTDNQHIFVSNIDKTLKDNTLSTDEILIGCPGTGKTFLAIYKALKLLKEKDEIKKIVIFRSAETTQEVGFLPGNLAEKSAPYQNGIMQIINEIFDRGDAYETMQKHNLIEFQLPVFMRSITLKNTAIIVDEIQNLTEEQLETIYTRSGEDSHLFLCGDYIQSDLKKENRKQDVLKFLRTLSKMNNPGNFYIFKPKDIVRNNKVKDYIMTKYGEEYREVYKEFEKIAFTS